MRQTLMRLVLSFVIAGIMAGAVGTIVLSPNARAQTTPAAGQPARTIYLKCGKLLDGRSDQARSNVVLAIEGEKIKEVGGAAAGGNVIDLSRETCLPGL